MFDIEVSYLSHSDSTSLAVLPSICYFLLLSRHYALPVETSHSCLTLMPFGLSSLRVDFPTSPSSRESWSSETSPLPSLDADTSVWFFGPTGRRLYWLESSSSGWKFLSSDLDLSAEGLPRYPLGLGVWLDLPSRGLSSGMQERMMAMQGSRQLKMLARGIEYVMSSKSIVERTEMRRPLMTQVLWEAG